MRRSRYLIVRLITAITIPAACVPSPPPQPSPLRIRIVGDSRLGWQTTITAAIETPTIDVVDYQGVPATTMVVAPTGPSLIQPHAAVPSARDATDVDITVYVFGPNEIPALTGGSPPYWDGVPVPFQTVRDGWISTIRNTRSCWRVFATQPSEAFVAVHGQPAAAWTDNARALNGILHHEQAAGTMSRAYWGETADQHIAANGTGPGTWFATGDVLHPEDGAGASALGSTIRTAVETLDRSRCHNR